MVINIKSISIRTTKENEKHLPAYDYSTLSAIAMCPAWGAIRYGQKKTIQLSERKMALEAGSLAHEVFAVLRLQNVLLDQKYAFDTLKEITRQFSKEATDRINNINDAISADPVTLIDTVIDTSQYYNDPDDKKRTVDNIRESLYFYQQNFHAFCEDNPVYVDKKKGWIGTEHPFDLMVTITYTDINDKEYVLKCRFIGKCDGIHHNLRRDVIEVHENKTSSRIDDNWLAQWQLSHQITGYCLAGQVFTKQNCNNARVLGMQIPLPKNSPMNGIRIESINREDHMFDSWARWFVTCVRMYEAYTNNPSQAPQYTHSCSRYFSSCMFLPICMMPEAEREETINELPVSEWSPLDD